MDAFANTTIKGYELRERVGAGSSGIVYRAYQPSIGREVAVKIIQPQLANQPDFVRRFEVEAQLVARLEHPHIVPLFDYWRDPEGAYLVMRWLPDNLRSAVTRGVWSPATAARLLDQITAALTVAHRDNVIHRDIKPDNILLDEDENAYLADFSIAKDLSLRDIPYNLTGTPAYLSPEQIKNEPLTPRTDIYSLGFVIYEVLTGERAFPDASTPDEYIDRHLHTPLPLASQRSPQIPSALDEVLQTATAKDPSRRYINAVRFAAAFRAALPVLASRAQAQPLADPLTERELDVLRLMVDGLDNRQISAKLFLSTSTVRWYTKQIYNKLDAHSRHQAIERARALQLTEPAIISIPSVDSVPETTSPARGKSEMPAPEPVNPYKGLRSFQEADAADFFGRAAFIEQLLNRLLDDDGGTRFLVLVGPSGSGKSSIVKAGLIPALRVSSNSAPFIAEMTPGTHPLEELEAALLRISVNPIPGLLDQLREDRRGLVRVAKRVLPADPDTEIALIVDQFEELFTLVEDEDMRKQFIEQLLSAAFDPRGRVRVILSLRADFYDRPLLYPRFAELVRSHTEVIVPLSAREMEQAIVAPAERVGVRLESGLVATMIQDVGEQPGSLPLLQYALTELFEKREGVVLTLDAYRTMGGVLSALARRADDIYEGLDPVAQELTRQIFLRMVTLGEGTEDTRRRAPLSELTGLGEEGMVEDIINVFAQYRLITFDRDPLTHTPTVEIAHEALIREWDKLREWLAYSRADVRMQRGLAQLASEWNQAQQDSSFLARGARFEQITSWAQETELLLTPDEQIFLAASQTQLEQERQAEIEREAREKQLEQRSRNFLRGLVAVFALAALIAVGLSLVAISERNRAQAALAAEQEALASSEQNLSVSRELALVNGAQAAFANNDLDTARALSLEAIELPNPSNATYQMLADAAYAPGTMRILYDDRYNAGWYAAALSQDERYLITLSLADGQPVIWDLISGEVVGVLPEFDIWDVVFRPTDYGGDRQVLTLSGAGMTLWDFEQRQPLRIYTGQQGEIWPAAFSPDGERIITGSEDGRLYLWDTDSGEILHTLEGHTDAINSVRFSPDGTTALSSSMDGTVALWEVAAGVLDDHFEMGFTPDYLAFSPQGDHFLVTGDGIRTMFLWDIEDRREIRRFSHIGPVYSPHFSRDGQTVMAATGNHIVFWDIERTAVLRTLSGHAYTTPFFPLADETKLVSYSGDATIRLWDLRDGTDIINVQIPRLGTDSDISPDEQTFVIGSGGADEAELPGLVILLDAATGAEIRRFGENGVAHTSSPNSVRFSSNGQMILSSDRSGEIKLWNVEDGTLLHSYPGLSSSVNSVEFTPDGSAFIAATDEGDVVQGDVNSGQIVQRFSFDAPVWRAIFSPDGRQFLACLADETSSITLVDYATGETLLTLLGQTPCLSLAFSPDGASAVSGHIDGSIYHWDITDGQLIRQFSGEQGRINDLMFSPDGRTVFSGSHPRAGSALTFWDVATGEPYRRHSEHQRLVYGLDLTEDGRRLLSVSSGATALLSRIDTNEELIEWVHNNRYVPELTCEQRDLYHIEPLCAPSASING